MLIINFITCINLLHFFTLKLDQQVSLDSLRRLFGFEMITIYLVSNVRYFYLTTILFSFFSKFIMSGTRVFSKTMVWEILLYLQAIQIITYIIIKYMWISIETIFKNLVRTGCVIQSYCVINVNLVAAFHQGCRKL